MSHEPVGPIRLAMVSMVSIVMWTLGALAFLLAGVLLLPWRRHPAVCGLGRRLLRTAFAHYARVLGFFRIVTCEYLGFERLADQRDGYIVAANHPALWDVVFLLGKLEPMTCIFKADLLRNPMFTGGAVLSGFIPHSPAIRMIKGAVAALAAGERILWFPEGTRTRKSEGPLNPLQGSMALVARRTQAFVWPVIVTTDGDYLSKGWPVWRLPRRRTRIVMRLGEPLRCASDETVEAFNARLVKVYLQASA